MTDWLCPDTTHPARCGMIAPWNEWHASCDLIAGHPGEHESIIDTVGWDTTPT